MTKAQVPGGKLVSREDKIHGLDFQANCSLNQRYVEVYCQFYWIRLDYIRNVSTSFACPLYYISDGFVQPLGWFWGYPSYTDPKYCL